MRNGTVLPGLTDPARPYHDARAPTYVVSGNPGNAEETSVVEVAFQAWTAWRSYQFGYSHMVVHNRTALGVDFLSTQLGGQITDRFDLTKTRSCNFGQYCDPKPLGRGGQSKSKSKSKIDINSKREHAGAGRGGHTAEHERKGSPGTAAAAALPTGPVAAAAELERMWRRAHAVPGGVPTGQRAALLALYAATDGARWNRSTHWQGGGDPCDPSRPWFGVSCARVTERTLPRLWNASGAAVDGVTAVQLPSNNLRGAIPAGLGKGLAQTLQLLDLSSNLLEGELPQTLLMGLPRLHTLYVEPQVDELQYRLTGTLPAGMGSGGGLPNLRYLGLSRNQLTGPIPASFGSLPCRAEHATGAGKVDPSAGGEVGCLIWLLDNNLTAAVPHAMCNATYNEVYVGGNALACPRPCLRVAYGNWPSCSAPCTPC